MNKSIATSPLIVKIAIGITFLNTLIILFVWPGRAAANLLLINQATWNGLRWHVVASDNYNLGVTVRGN